MLPVPNTDIRSFNDLLSIEENVRNAYTDNIPLDISKKKLPPTYQKDKDGVLFWQHQMVVPKDEELHAKVISQHHDHRTVGHPGINRTHELITRSYWWPTVRHDVKKYVQGCTICQRVKKRTRSLAAPLHPHSIPEGNWEVISMDLIGPLPESNGYNCINVIVDRKSKLAHFIPTTTELSSLGQAKIMRDHVFKLHGIPKKIITDCGLQYVSKFMGEFF